MLVDEETKLTTASQKADQTVTTATKALEDATKAVEELEKSVETAKTEIKTTDTALKTFEKDYDKNKKADITLQEIFVSVLPFIALQITGMLLVMFYPDIALWFPKWLGS